jgi:hypothetical protein
MRQKLTVDEMTMSVQLKGGPGSGISGHRTDRESSENTITHTDNLRFGIPSPRNAQELSERLDSSVSKIQSLHRGRTIVPPESIDAVEESQRAIGNGDKRSHLRAQSLNLAAAQSQRLTKIPGLAAAHIQLASHHAQAARSAE